MPPRRRPDARRDATTRSTTCGATAGNDDDARARRRRRPARRRRRRASSPTGATGLAFVADARPNPNRRRRDRTPRSRRRDPRRDATRTRGPPTRARGDHSRGPRVAATRRPSRRWRAASPTASFSGRLGLGSSTLERPFAIARVFSTRVAPRSLTTPPPCPSSRRNSKHNG